MSAAASWSPALGASSSFNGTWSFTSIMAGLTQGTGVTNRVGNKIQIIAIEVLMNIIPLSVGVNGNFCRFVVFKYKDPNGSLPSMTTGPLLFDANTVQSGRNVSFKDCYTVLGDMEHQMVITSQGGTTSYGPKLFKKYRFPINASFAYNGNAGTISDCIEADYNIGVCSDNAGCCGLEQLYVKVWFKDI